MFCNVMECRFPHSHVTSAHTCSKCNLNGHGVCECGNSNLMLLLHTKYKDQFLPERLWCDIDGCGFKNTHTREAHQCSLCNVRSQHSQKNCPNLMSRINRSSRHNNNNTNNSVTNEPDDAYGVLVDFFNNVEPEPEP